MGQSTLVQLVPSAPEVRERIGHLLRELHLARRMLTLAKLADQYRPLCNTGNFPTAPTERKEVPGA